MATRSASAADFVIYDDADQVGVMKRVLEELHVDPRRFSPRAILSAISNAKSEMIVPAQPTRQRSGTTSDEVVAQAMQRYDRTLTQQRRARLRRPSE